MGNSTCTKWNSEQTLYEIGSPIAPRNLFISKTIKATVKGINRIKMDNGDLVVARDSTGKLWWWFLTDTSCNIVTDYRTVISINKTLPELQPDTKFIIANTKLDDHILLDKVDRYFSFDLPEYYKITETIYLIKGYNATGTKVSNWEIYLDNNRKITNIRKVKSIL